MPASLQAIAPQGLAVNCPNAVETVIATVPNVSTFQVSQRITLLAEVRMTVGAAATSVTYRWRRDSLTGALVGDQTAETVVASTTNPSSPSAQDGIAGEIAGRPYVLTATVAGGAAAGTAAVVNAVAIVQ